MRPTDVVRFMSAIDTTGEHWLWTRPLDNGYGRFWLDGRTVAAHRVAYELFVGPIPDGLQIDHLCRVRACQRPDHLEPVTIGENVLRGVGLSAANAAKTHCDAGHAFTEANTYRPPRNPNRRDCITCQRARVRAWRESQAS